MNPLHLAIAGALLAPLSLCQAQARFEWATGAFGGEANARVALLVPVLIGQRECHMQLDTGLPRAVAWHEYSGARADPRSVHVQFAGHQFAVEASKAVQDLIGSCQPGAPVGSLGNEFFEAGTLAIDFGSRHISYQPGSALGADPRAEPFFYSKAGPGGAHVVVEVGLGDARATALLDTGSAALGLGAFGAAHWSRLTGGAPLEKGGRVEVFEIPAWGRQHRCFKASSAVAVRIASGALGHPTVTYCPTIGVQGRGDLIGVVGMRPFSEDLLVIDYPARRWSARKSAARAE